MHLAYEIEQMVDAALRITAAVDLPTRNALLESTLLHARALIEFLLGSGRSTDILAFVIWMRALPPVPRQSLRCSPTPAVDHRHSPTFAQVSSEVARDDAGQRAACRGLIILRSLVRSQPGPPCSPLLLTA
jgi:hypothetical protein